MTGRDPEYPGWLTNPGDTAVLLVVVDEYAGYPALAGIAEQAALFADRLIGHRVAPARINVLVSETGWRHFPPGCVWHGTAKQENLNNAITQIPGWDAALLWVHWIGHGFYREGGAELLTAEAAENYDTVVRLARLRALLEVGNHVPERQIFTIDACQLNYQETQPIPLHGLGRTSLENARQFIMFGSRPGNSAVIGTSGGLFSEALMTVLAEVAEPGEWPPDTIRLTDSATEWLREKLGGRIDQIQYLTKNPRDLDFVDRRTSFSSVRPRRLTPARG